MNEELDDKDQKILEILKDHAEYTTRQIAKKTLLPVTTIHNRIRKMRSSGVIKKYSIEPDYSKINRGLLVYILVSVNLEILKEKKKSQYDLLNEIRKFYFVERADVVSGGTDLVVTIRVKDVEEFDKCLITKFQLLEGIEKTQSLMVIHGK